MAFPLIPQELLDLHKLEVRLVSPRIPFMKIFEAPRGRQLKIRGNVVNVATDIVTTHMSLPRMEHLDETIKVKLKRDLKYHNHVMSANVRPERIKVAAHFLATKGPLFKQLGIVYNADWQCIEGM